MFFNCLITKYLSNWSDIYRAGQIFIELNNYIVTWSDIYWSVIYGLCNYLAPWSDKIQDPWFCIDFW